MISGKFPDFPLQATQVIFDQAGVVGEAKEWKGEQELRSVKGGLDEEGNELWFADGEEAGGLQEGSPRSGNRN